MWGVVLASHGQKDAAFRLVGETIHKEMRDQWVGGKFSVDGISKKRPFSMLTPANVITMNFTDWSDDPMPSILRAGFLPLGGNRFFEPETRDETIAEALPRIQRRIWEQFQGDCTNNIESLSVFGIRQSGMALDTMFREKSV